MKLLCLFGLLATLLVSSCAGTRHSVQLGAATLSSDYEPVDEQTTLGWSMNTDQEESGVGYEFALQVGSDSATVAGLDVDSTNVEFYGGPRYEWVLDKVRPYLSGGLSLLNSEFEGSDGFVVVSDDDTSIGIYLGGGIDFDITDQMFIGIGLRQTIAHEVTLFGLDGDADFTQVFLRVGMGF